MQQAARISDYTAFFLNGEVIEFGEKQIKFSQCQRNLKQKIILQVVLVDG